METKNNTHSEAQMQTYQKGPFSYPVPDGEDMADVALYFAEVVGKPIPSMPGFSWSYDETYKTQAGRDKMRAALLLPAPVKSIEVAASLSLLTEAEMEREEAYMESNDGF